VLGLLPRPVQTDVQRGDIPEKSDYQEIEGLTPDFILGFDQALDDTEAEGSKTNIDEGVYHCIAEKDAVMPCFFENHGWVIWNEKGAIESGHV